MACCKRTHSWGTSLVGRDGAPTQYSVQLGREPDGCTAERYRILVNNQEIPHQLTTNFFSPLCGSGGAYEWVQDGHSFMLIYNSLGLFRSMRGFRLFIDGIDVGTGLQFRAFFRQRGFQFVLAGLCALIMGLGTTLAPLFMEREILGGFAIYFGYGLLAWGAVHLFMGAISFARRYAEPRYIP